MTHSTYLLAASVLLAGFLPLALVAIRAEAIDGLAAVQTSGTVTTLALICLAVGSGQSAFAAVAVVCAVSTVVGGLVFARFMDRDP
jgi:multisubunit Na+/H+ antiporter MnhF subunit